MDNPELPRLYVDYLHPPSLSVLALVLFTKIPFQIKSINTLRQENLAPEYKAINPLGTVPAIIDKDIVIQGSHAILRFICNMKKGENNWYPEDIKKRAAIDSYLDWHEGNIKRCHLYFQAYYAHVMPKAYFSWDVSEEKALIVKALEDLENIFLKENKYIASNDAMTIADLSAACAVLCIRQTRIDFEAFPKVKEWLDRCMQHPEMNKANMGVSTLIQKATSKLHM